MGRRFTAARKLFISAVIKVNKLLKNDGIGSKCTYIWTRISSQTCYATNPYNVESGFSESKNEFLERTLDII